MTLMRIGVTGHSGMLGRHVDAALRGSGFQVVPIARTATAPTGGRHWDLRHWKTASEFDAILNGIDAIVHCAAVIDTSGDERGLVELFDVNVRACVNLGEWASTRRVPIVFISSSSVYENPKAVDITESASINASGLGGFYALTKIVAEDAFARLRFRGLRIAVIRPSSLYGTGEPSSKLVSKFLAVASAGDRIELTAPHDDTVNLVHAADVANAVVGVLRAQAWSTYNVAGAAPTTIRQVAEKCVDVVGRGSVLLQPAAGQTRARMNRFQLNCDAAMKDFGFLPVVDLAMGVRALFEGRVISVAKERHG